MTRKDFEEIASSVTLKLHGRVLVNYNPADADYEGGSSGTLSSKEGMYIGNTIPVTKGITVFHYMLGQNTETMVKWKDIDLA
jgi:hypothetical protein